MITKSSESQTAPVYPLVASRGTAEHYFLSVALGEWMDILEMGPGVSVDALLMQQVVTEVQHFQMDAAPQCLLSHLLNQILIYLQLLDEKKDTNRSQLL